MIELLPVSVPLQKQWWRHKPKLCFVLELTSDERTIPLLHWLFSEKKFFYLGCVFMVLSWHTKSLLVDPAPQMKTLSLSWQKFQVPKVLQIFCNSVGGYVDTPFIFSKWCGSHCVVNDGWLYILQWMAEMLENYIALKGVGQGGS